MEKTWRCTTCIAQWPDAAAFALQPRVCCAESQTEWEYLPLSSAPHNPNPGQLLQLQLCMHATGARHRYAISWARTSMRIVRIPYSFETLVAVARSLNAVHNLYSQPGVDVPDGVSSFPLRLRVLLQELAAQVQQVYNSSVSIPVPGARADDVAHSTQRASV